MRLSPRRVTRLFSCALLACTAGLAHAQYVGPGTVRAPSNLTELLQYPVDGQRITLRGYLLQQLNQEKFLFSDGKSQIRVQIEAASFPQQAIDDKTEIEITGKVEKDFMETPEIDVKTLSILPPRAPFTSR